MQFTRVKIRREEYRKLEKHHRVLKRISDKCIRRHRKREKPMWAASLISGQPWASIIISSSPRQMCLPAPKFLNQKNTGAVGRAVLAAAFKSKPEPSHSGERVLEPQRESHIKASPQQQDRQLSGTDVLRALQRASVEKAKLSWKQKKNNKKRDIMTSGRGAAEQLALDDYTNSRIQALSIKSEWGVRLEELEMRLQEIMLLD